MPDPVDELRAVSDEILEDATTMRSLTVENRSLPAGSSRGRDVASAMERVARRILGGARREHALVSEVHGQALEGGRDAPTATIEDTEPEAGQNP
jgi:hypothetical protein